MNYIAMILQNQGNQNFELQSWLQKKKQHEAKKKGELKLKEQIICRKMIKSGGLTKDVGSLHKELDQNLKKLIAIRFYLIMQYKHWLIN